MINIGDKVAIIDRHGDLLKEKILHWYDEDDGIPEEYLIHGQIKFAEIYFKEFATVKYIIDEDDTDIEEKLYVCSFKTIGGDITQLGFKEKQLKKVIGDWDE